MRGKGKLMRLNEVKEGNDKSIKCAISIGVVECSRSRVSDRVSCRLQLQPHRPFGRR